MSDRPVCVIAGAGAGNGLAFARRFATAGHRIVLMAREPGRLRTLSETVGGDTLALPCDVRDPLQVQTAFAAAREQAGPVDVLIYNAGAGAFGSIEQVSTEDFESAWRTNALGCFCAVKAVLSDLRAQRGSVVIIGATASVKAGAGFAAFAPAKAALRSLAQSLARQLGPDGVHVAHVVIDGVIDLPRTRQALADKPDSFFMRPQDVADSVYQLTRQPPSAWTFELDLRPFGERW